jgi:hypothetical protein
MPAYDRLAAAGRERGCVSILTGGGGDEWLIVSPYYAADLIRRRDFKGLYRLWSAMSQSLKYSRLTMLKSAVWTTGLRPLVGAAVRRALRDRAPGLYAARLRRADRLPPWLAPDPELRREIWRRSSDYFGNLYFGDGNYYDYDVATTLDHSLSSMEYEDTFEECRTLGMSIRHPFLDADLTELLYRMKPELLNRGGRSKGLVRETLSRRFPTLGFGKQRKISALDFYTSSVLGDAPAVWKGIGGIRALEQLGIVDPELLGECGEQLTASTKARVASRYWGLLSLECWARDVDL